jgi:hypothetical protein
MVVNPKRAFACFLSFLISFALVPGSEARADSNAKAISPPDKPRIRTAAMTPAPPPPTMAAHEEAIPSPPPSGRDDRIPVMATLGYGSNDLSIGIGVRAGKMLTDRIYVGGTGVYHLGHEIASSSALGYTSSASMSAFYIGPEVGYDFHFAPVTVRVYSGLGIIWFHVTSKTSGPGIPTSSADASTNKFVIWPGATVFYPLPESSFFIGGDLHFVTVPDGPAAELFALAGTRF